MYELIKNAIADIDEMFIEEASSCLPEKFDGVSKKQITINAEDLIEMKKQIKKSNFIAKIAAIAAVFVVTFAAVLFAVSITQSSDISVMTSTSETVTDKEYNEKIKVSELAEAIPQALNLETDNLILPDKILIDDNIAIKEYRKVPVKYDLQADFQNILEDYFGKDSVSEKYFSQTNPQYLDYINTENNNRAVVSKSGAGSGYLVITRHGGLGLKMTNIDHPVKAVYHIDRKDYTDTQYKLSGEDYGVDEAAAFAENWARDFWSKYHPEYEYSAKTVVVRPAPQEIDESGSSFTYEIIIEMKLCGVPIDELGQLFTKNDDKVFGYQYITIKMAKPEDVFYFGASASSYSALASDSGSTSASDNDSTLNSDDNKNEEKIIDDIISPSHAVTLASEYMSGYNQLEIDSFSLKYAIASDRLIPVWAFEMDVNSKTTTRTSIYVNALSGEVYAEMEYAFAS